MTEPSVPSFGESVRLPKTPREPRLSRGQIIVAFYVLLALLAFGIGWLRGAPNVMVYPGREAAWLWSLAAGVAAGLLVVAASRLSVRHFVWARVLHHEFAGVIRGLSASEIWLLALSSSVAEELFFRGALQPWCGVILSSLFFAALHVRADRRFLPWTAMSLIVGLMFAAMFQWTGSLVGPIACHFLINFLNLRYIARAELPVR